ncbi:septum formation family protein [Georgenia sp. Z1491]|uniref:septum formation family protein n=1 Tax=Georgenia sp. Z1491 TaxID=3416707 RepID=UPI003CF91256
MNQWSAQSPGSGAPGGWGSAQTPQQPAGYGPGGPWQGGQYPAPMQPGPGGPWNGGGGPDGGNRAVYIVLGIAAVLVVALVVTGLLLHRSFTSGSGAETTTSAPGPDQDPGGGTTTQPSGPTAPPGVEASGPTTVFDIEVGNCALYEDYTAVSNDLVLTPCAQPHYMEFFHVFDVEDRDQFPGVETINAEAREECDAFWNTLPEVDLDLSRINLSTLAPSEATWEQGDREVLCIARTADDTDTIQGNFQDGSAVLVS